MASVDELVAEIGIPEHELRRVLRRDDRYINRLIVLGLPEDEAEYQSFRADLKNVLSLMRSHRFSAKTAARILGQTPEEPFEFNSTTEDETEPDQDVDEPNQDEDERDQNEDEDEPDQDDDEPDQHVTEDERDQDEDDRGQDEDDRDQDENEPDDEDTEYPDSSCSNSMRDTCSITSSDDEKTVTKKIRLDPDYVPSQSSSETTPATTTANSSQMPSEEEPMSSSTDTEEDDTLVLNDTTTEEDEELEVATEEDDL
jgi:hypothetical protein